MAHLLPFKQVSLNQLANKFQLCPPDVETINEDAHNQLRGEQKYQSYDACTVILGGEGEVANRVVIRIETNVNEKVVTAHAKRKRKLVVTKNGKQLIQGNFRTICQLLSTDVQKDIKKKKSDCTESMGMAKTNKQKLKQTKKGKDYLMQED